MTVYPEQINIPSNPYEHSLLRSNNTEFLTTYLESEFPAGGEYFDTTNHDVLWHKLFKKIKALNEPHIWELALHISATSEKPSNIAEDVVIPNSRPVEEIAGLTAAGIIKGSPFLKKALQQAELTAVQLASLRAVEAFIEEAADEAELKERALQVFGSITTEGTLEKALGKDQILVQQEIFLIMLRIWATPRFQ